MRALHRRFRQFAAFALLALPASIAGAASWYDNFQDGSITDNNPETWITNLGGFFPGDYNATSGDLVMTPVIDPENDNQMSGFVPTGFTNTYTRTQGYVIPDPNNPDNDGGNLVLLNRVNPEALQGYLMYFDVSGNLQIQILDGPNTFSIGESIDVEFNAGSEVIMEFNAVGDQLEGYVWLADDPNGKPAVPQATATDTTYTAGLAGIAYAEDEENTVGVFRWAAAQDTPFADASNGDFDDDNDVDGEDFLIWQRGFGATEQLNGSTGDADGDGDVDGLDLDVWKSKFGGPPAVAAAVGAVPEPTSIALGFSGLLAIAALRKRARC